MGRPFKNLEERIGLFLHNIEVDCLGCYNWLGAISPQGYGRSSLFVPYISTDLCHRASFWLYNGYLPEIVMHSCDNRGCCYWGHLREGTHSDNMKDMYNKGRGRYQNGESNRSSEISKEMASIIWNYKGKMGRYKLAEILGVSKYIINNIWYGGQWNEVKEQEWIQ